MSCSDDTDSDVSLNLESGGDSSSSSSSSSEFPTTYLTNNRFTREVDEKELKLLYSSQKEEKEGVFQPNTYVLGVATSRWNELVAFACGRDNVFIAKIKSNSSVSSKDRFDIKCVDAVTLPGGFRSVCFVGDRPDNQFVLCGSESNKGLTLLKVDENGKLAGEKICDDDASCTESYINTLRSCQTAEKDSNRFLAVTGEDQHRVSVVMCDPKEGVKQVELLKCAGGGCNCACFSFCGTYVLVAGRAEKACAVYDVSSGKECKHLRDISATKALGESQANGVALCRKNELLVIGGSDIASIHDFESGEILHTITFEHGGGIHGTAFNYGCDVLAIGTWNSKLALIDCSPSARKPSRISQNEQQEKGAEKNRNNENGCFPLLVAHKSNGDVRQLAIFQTGVPAIDSLLCLGLMNSDGAVYEIGGAEKRWQARKFVAYLHFKKQNSESKFAKLCDRETGVWNVFRTVMSMLG